MKTNEKIFALCEGAIMIALAIALSYIEIELGAWGGSIGFAMIPIVVFALRHGVIWGVFSGFIFGTLKFFIGGGVVANVISLILDYSVAYAAVGLAGFLGNIKNQKLSWTLGAFIGCFSRFIVSFISGVTVYAEYAEPEYLGIATPNAFVYSLIYNGAYMLPSTIITGILVPIIMLTLSKYKIVKR